MAYCEAIGTKRLENVATNEDKLKSGETNLSCDKIAGREEIAGRKAARSQLKRWNQGRQKGARTPRKH